MHLAHNFCFFLLLPYHFVKLLLICCLHFYHCTVNNDGVHYMSGSRRRPLILTLHLQRVSDFDGGQRLRSASTHVLVVPPTRTPAVGDHAFPAAATFTTRRRTIIEKRRDSQLNLSVGARSP